MTPEQKMRNLIDEVYGSLSIENPNITREFVEKQLRLRERAKMTVDERWSNGIPHHPKSVELFTKLADIDNRLGNGYFDWRHGGDGDNGEQLMYELDILFEAEERNGTLF